MGKRQKNGSSGNNFGQNLGVAFSNFLQNLSNPLASAAVTSSAPASNLGEGETVAAHHKDAAESLVLLASSAPSSGDKRPHALISEETEENTPKPAKRSKKGKPQSDYSVLFPSEKDYVSRIEHGARADALPILYKLPHDKIDTTIKDLHLPNSALNNNAGGVAFLYSDNLDVLTAIRGALSKRTQKLSKSKNGTHVETHLKTPYIFFMGNVEALGKSYNDKFSLSYIEERLATRCKIESPQAAAHVASLTTETATTNSNKQEQPVIDPVKESLFQFIQNITSIRGRDIRGNHVFCYKGDFSDRALQNTTFVRLQGQMEIPIQTDGNSLYIPTDALLNLAKAHNVSDLLAEKVTSMHIAQLEAQKGPQTPGSRHLEGRAF